MITQRVLCFVALAAALAGCGASATETAHRTTPAAEEAPSQSAFGWQADLDRREQGRIAQPLWLWLDGDLPEGVDVLGVEDPKVRVTAKLRHALYEDEIDHFARLGFDAVEGSAEIQGLVTRDQLLEAAREHNVLRLDAGATAAEQPSEEATAQADTEQSPRRM